ncbi:TMEM175 family protein [Natronolimnohabitans innermongolicus]|uniref:Integral membrane protein n=1 Tax=Natronolimnohabitans innermongolicus JCM 12255 TaxID=1227499 RepID=L9WRP8_9EURY|nr:TMEM175 family protein [Natronolimnohabitans innermongolicus]ELY50978.1 hypothetical protein C493_18371 [Natronolimnohabitans innermongolicus JCM 12255]
MTNNETTTTDGQDFPDDLSPVETDLFSSVERFSLAVFGFSFTLLGTNFVLDTGGGEESFGQALPNLVPVTVAFVISIFVVALYWWEHHKLLRNFRGIDTTLIGMNFLYLVPIILIPFVSEAVGQFPENPWAWVMFGGTMAMLLVVRDAMMVYAWWRGLLIEDVPIRREFLRQSADTIVILASLPLAFVLVDATWLLWMLSWPIEQLIQRFY